MLDRFWHTGSFQCCSRCHVVIVDSAFSTFPLTPLLFLAVTVVVLYARFYHSQCVRPMPSHGNSVNQMVMKRELENRVLVEME